MLIAKSLTIVSPLLKNHLNIRNVFNQIGHFTWKILHWQEILVNGRNVEKSLEEALTLVIVSSCYLLKRLSISFLLPTPVDGSTKYSWNSPASFDFHWPCPKHSHFTIPVICNCSVIPSFFPFQVHFSH